jgi:hypothetical protein
VLVKPAQLEMADLKDRFGNFDGESIGHQQCSADILAEELQPTKDVDVPPDNTEIETIARAKYYRRRQRRSAERYRWKYAAESPVVRSGVPPVLSALQPGPTHRLALDRRPQLERSQ